MTICKNCGHSFDGNFCNNCGQSSKTKRLNLLFIWHDIQHGLLHVNKELLYSIKEMFTRPGSTIREFIDGKRVNHFKPFSFVIVIAAIYGVLYHFFHIHIVTSMVNDFANAPTITIKKFDEWRLSHLYIIELVYLPIISFSSWFVFRKSHLNFTEHFVLNAFITGQVLIVNLILLPILVIYNETPTLNVLSKSLFLIKFSIVWWGYSQFFKPVPQVKIFFKTILTFLFLFLFFIIIAIIFSLIYKLLLIK
jgi:hypothetical protein